MTAMMLATLLAIAINAPAQGPAHKDRDRCPRDVDAAFSQLDRSLRSMGDNIDHVGNDRDRKKLRDDLNAAIRASERARNEACDAAGNRGPDRPVIVVPAPLPPPPPRVMNAAGFNELLNAVKKESFDDGRLRVVQAALVGDICVTTDQVKALMAAPAFTTGKVDVARLALPRVVDIERVYLLNQAFVFESDKAEMAKIQPTAGSHPACRIVR